MLVSMIAAVSKENFGIGYQGKLLFNIPEDLARFKKVTMGFPIIMGENTWLSLPKKPLPGRRNIVLGKGEHEGAETAHSIEETLELVKNEEEVFVIGGGMVYQQFLPLASKLYITEIYNKPENVDTFFPDYTTDFKCVWREYHLESGIRYEFTRYERNMPDM